jgi:hypothetical protein
MKLQFSKYGNIVRSWNGIGHREKQCIRNVLANKTTTLLLAVWFCGYKK